MASGVGNSLAGAEPVNALLADQLTLDAPPVETVSSGSSLLESQDWDAIFALAQDGCAPAQYIVAGSFEKRGDIAEAQEWYQRCALQNYTPAASRLAQLRSIAAR